VRDKSEDIASTTMANALIKLMLISIITSWGMFLQLSNAFAIINRSLGPSTKACHRARTTPHDDTSSHAETTASSQLSQVSRRDTLASAISLIPATGIMSSFSSTVAVADDDNEGRLIQFDVANLDGIEGNTGSFTIKTHPSWAPRGVQRFEELTQSGFWSGCRFFRVLPGFVSQFGINGNPSTQAKWRDKSIADDTVKVSNRRGTVVFATSGPNTRTTQIFINTGDRNNFLDKQGFSPFGEVISGMDVVDRFYSAYGEGYPQGKGPNQALIQIQGESYLNKNYPKLSFITNAQIIN